jgi:hypothetical protein
MTTKEAYALVIDDLKAEMDAWEPSRLTLKGLKQALKYQRTIIFLQARMMLVWEKKP